MDPVAVAQRLKQAIEEGDVEAVRELYHPDVRIWHNNDGQVQTRDENLRVLRWLTRTVHERRYEITRRERTETGFVQQHVLRGTLSDGRHLELPACLVVEVSDGRIKTLDEYFDSAHAAVLFS